jgi:hypothetical protein
MTARIILFIPLFIFRVHSKMSGFLLGPCNIKG